MTLPPSSVPIAVATDRLDSAGEKPLDTAISDFLRVLRRPAHLLIAISGGSDSTGLLVALSEAVSALPSADVRLSAATIDHALRPEAASEAKAVAALCARLGIPHVIRRWNGDKPASGISAAAREARYHLLSGIADELGATAIVTGHTSDDQIETVTMRAARQTPLDVSFPQPIDGSGPPRFAIGLSGMAEATLLDGRHWILRPLLGIGRAGIRRFLFARDLGWIDDPSNLDDHYERVRIRQTLSAETQAASGLLLSIAAAGQARAALSRAAAGWLEAHATVCHGVVAKISADGLPQDASDAATRHALSTLAAVLGGRAHGLSQASSDRLMAFLEAGVSGRMTAGRVVFDRRRDALYLLRENRGLPVLIVGAGESGLWDGRFSVDNRSAHPVTITPGGGTITPGGERVRHPELPPGVAKLAVKSLPHSDPEFGDTLRISPYLAPFDRFLPAFDLALANRLALLMGRDTYLLPPA